MKRARMMLVTSMVIFGTIGLFKRFVSVKHTLHHRTSKKLFAALPNILCENPFSVTKKLTAAFSHGEQLFI